MSVVLNQNNNEQEIENSKSNKPTELHDNSPDAHQLKDENTENQKPQENGATKSEDFPDLKRKKVSIEEVTWDIENGLRWIRKELTQMREQDRILTKQLIGMRSKVNEISQMVEADEKAYDDEERPA